MKHLKIYEDYSDEEIDSLFSDLEKIGQVKSAQIVCRVKCLTPQQLVHPSWWKESHQRFAIVNVLVGKSRPYAEGVELPVVESAGVHVHREGSSQLVCKLLRGELRPVTDLRVEVVSPHDAELEHFDRRVVWEEVGVLAKVPRHLRVHLDKILDQIDLPPGFRENEDLLAVLGDVGL